MRGDFFCCVHPALISIKVFPIFLLLNQLPYV
jgi:hypothetical protein